MTERKDRKMPKGTFAYVLHTISIIIMIFRFKLCLVPVELAPVTRDSVRAVMRKELNITSQVVELNIIKMEF